MNQAELETLIRRYLDGQCTPAEARRVEVWYNRTLETQKPDLSGWDYAKLHGDVLVEIHRRRQSGATVANDGNGSKAVKQPKMASKRVPRYVRTARIAAGLALFALAAVLGYYFLATPTADPVVADIAPGGNRATLTLEDGRTVELSADYSEIVTREGDIIYRDGTVLLDRDGFSANYTDAHALSASIYQLATPKGGTYQVTLPDGSRVWLNAASSLKYPTRFDENERVVELEGEAYFEVAHRDSLPFKVRTVGQTIEVLGTAFNISAYVEEPGQTTTLVSGSVRVSDLQTNTLLLLTPGQQAVNQNGGLTRRTVDIQPYTAWKEGIFLFDETPLDEVMRNITRWYDVEIDYDRLPARQISGIVSRDQPLSAVLHSLAITGNKFTLKERRLLFMEE